MALLYLENFDTYTTAELTKKWSGFTAHAESVGTAFKKLKDQFKHLEQSVQGVNVALKVKSGVNIPMKSPVKTGVDYDQHLKTKPVTGQVSSTKAIKGEQIAGSMESSQTLHEGVFTNGMSITVEGGRVINLGNYETARIGVTITVPCSKDSLEDSYTYATEWVSEKIEEAVKMAKQ